MVVMKYSQEVEVEVSAPLQFSLNRITRTHLIQHYNKILNTKRK